MPRGGSQTTCPLSVGGENRTPVLGLSFTGGMIMRRLLVAGFAALAVLLGLIATTGTAFAQGPDDGVIAPAPVPSATAQAGAEVKVAVDAELGVKTTNDLRRNAHTCATGQYWNGTACVPVPTSGDPICTPPRVLNSTKTACVLTGDHGSGFPRGGSHGYPGSWNDRLDGRYFRLDQGPALDVCDSGASNYDLWLNRNGSYRDRIIRQLNAQRWNDLRRSDCGAVSVSNDGQCVTYRQDALRYGNDLNTNRRDWSGLRLRLLSSHHGWNGSDLSLLSLSERNDWNRFSSLDRQRFDNYNRVYSQLRTVCSDPNPPVVIVQAPAAVTYAAPAATPSGNDAAAAPAPAPTTGSIPSGHYEGGGNSVAYTLAHARAI